MLMHTIMSALLVILTLGSPGGSTLINHTNNRSFADTDYNNGRTTAPGDRAETQRGINPVQHSE